MFRRRLLSAFGCLLLARSAVAQAPDLGALRARLQSRDVDTARRALVALGRFERPALIPVILPSLQSPLAEVRAGAADAIGQAAQAWRAEPPPRRAVLSIESVVATLVARLEVETDADVRGAITETIGRLPYTTPEQVTAAAAVLAAAPADAVPDRLGIARGAESLFRLNRSLMPPAGDLKARLKSFVSSDPGRDARVRRLAMDALVEGTATDDGLVARAAADPDAQVRRLAMRASATRPGAASRDVLARGLADEAAMVRYEALRGLGSEDDAGGPLCQAARTATGDRDLRVALLAFDDLARCPEDVALLDLAVGERFEAETPRAWHKAAHALVALASVDPDRARAALPQFVASQNWPMRLYAVRAAVIVGSRASLDQLAGDADETVKRSAVQGLTLFGVQLDPPGEVSRSVAQQPSAGPPLQSPSPLRARVTVRDVGTFEMTLLASEAPVAVAELVSLADSGQSSGLVFRRVRPNVVAADFVGGGSVPSAPVSARDEVGPWPHVRGAVGIDGHGAFFIDLVDNPDFDHQYPVFAQVLGGLDVVDQILEGDVIDRIEILRR